MQRGFDMTFLRRLIGSPSGMTFVQRLVAAIAFVVISVYGSVTESLLVTVVGLLSWGLVVATLEAWLRRRRIKNGIRDLPDIEPRRTLTDLLADDPPGGG